MKPTNIENQVRSGIEDVVRTFDAIEAGALGEALIQSALMEAVKPLESELQTGFNSIKGTGFGKYGKPFENVNVTFRTFPSRKLGNVVRTGPQGFGWQTIHLIEYGTVTRYKKNGQKTGIMPATGFIRTAVLNQRKNVILLGAKIIQDEIFKQAKQGGIGG